MSLENRTTAAHWRTIVPLHRELRPSTLSDILNQSGVTKEDWAALL